jgi:hypothetical protein
VVLVVSINSLAVCSGAEMALLDFFGTTPDYLTGLLGDDLNRYRQDANQQALQAAALGLLQAGAPSATPGGGALAIARGLQMGQQAYKSALREGVQERLAGLQMQDFLQKQAEQQAVRRFLPNLIQQVPGQNMIFNQPSQVIRDEEGNLMPGATIGQPTQQINQQALQQLALAAPETFGKIATGLKALTPEYKEVGGQLYAIPQFGGTPTAVAGRPKRETVTVGNRVLDRDSMQVLYEAPEAPAASVKEFQDFMKLPPDQQKAYITLQEQKRPSTTINMPTEGERKAATLATRLNFSVGQLNEAIGQDPKAAIPNTTAEIARYVTGSDFLANKLNPEQRQIVEAAQLDILDAALTLGTGAAYTKEQLEGYRKSYFPQLGDKPEQIKTKQARLQNILRSAEIASGRAAGSVATPIPSMPTPQPSVVQQPPSVAPALRWNPKTKQFE